MAMRMTGAAGSGEARWSEGMEGAALPGSRPSGVAGCPSPPAEGIAGAGRPAGGSRCTAAEEGIVARCSKAAAATAGAENFASNPESTAAAAALGRRLAAACRAGKEEAGLRDSAV